MIVLALVVVALILALVDEVQAGGKSLLGWAVVLLAVASLLGSGVLTL
jgi:hypothetical protein